MDFGIVAQSVGGSEQVVTRTMINSMDDPELSATLRNDRLCDQFENSWTNAIRSNDKQLRPEIENVLSQVEPGERESLLCDLVALEIHFRRRCGEKPEFGEYEQRFPESSASLVDIFQDGESLRNASDVDSSDEMDNAIIPEKIGRFVVRERLGRGAFGIVLRAWDEELQRDVAIKIPTLKDRPGIYRDEQFGQEAQIAASLQHSNIVRLFDVLATDEYPCVLVSEFIDGTDLAHRIDQDRPDVFESARIVETIAEALHFAHTHALVHRDVKPANILVDSDGKAFLTDFGLALNEDDCGRGGHQGGTVAYMSPEQARGEGHLVTGTSDVFSLGAVFYELLTGRRAFDGGNWKEVLERVKNAEPRSPRLFNEQIPQELERICMKAMSKRSVDRYSVARDMARDLEAFRVECDAESTERPSAESSSVQVVPKGLCSFEAEDADFFLELTPGPRDRSGIPDCIRFWKTRIENTTKGEAFRVGLIYGVSGAGKSSLVKAGIIPRLGDHIHSLLVDATNEDLERSILSRLDHLFANLDTSGGLAKAMTHLRCGSTIPADKKLVIFIDQFEQWLNAKNDFEHADLVAALRQCDGHKIQAVLLVRDDFWIPVSRFMGELEMPIREGQNAKVVDLFDCQHARRVLIELGRAYGRVQRAASVSSPNPEAFIQRAVSDLSENGRVSPVQLVLFCEVVKDKEWSMAAYDKVGGASNAVHEFLHRTFSTSTAHARHRIHKQPAIRVLEALLPAVGADIRGKRVDKPELQLLSGYADDADAFRDLMQILNGELRVITPVDQTGTIGKAHSGTDRTKFFQLTHDYMVPSIRAWISLEQRRTARGRARLRLEEMTQLRLADSQHSFRPGLADYVKCRAFTTPTDWSPEQCQMMQTARRYFVFVSGALATLVVALLIIIGGQVRSHTKGMTLVEHIGFVDEYEIGRLCDSLVKYRNQNWAVGQLQGRFQRDFVPEVRCRYALALVHLGATDTEQLRFVYEHLLLDPERLRPRLNATISESRPGEALLKWWNSGDEISSAIRAELALSLSLLNEYGPLLSTLRTPEPDPTSQTLLIHEFSRQSDAASDIARLFTDALTKEDDAELARNLCLLLGECALADPDAQLRNELKSGLVDQCLGHSDPGVRSAIAWILRQWGLPSATDGNFDGGLARNRSPVVEADLFTCRIGSPEDEHGRDKDEEKIRDVAINRRIAVAVTEVTYAELITWFPSRDLSKHRGVSDDSPAIGISFYFAAEICNRLSELEGIPRDQWVFVRNDKGLYAEGMSLRPNYLSLGGYRMPTAAEWEAVYRWGTTSMFFFGNDPKYLGKYGWYSVNASRASRPVGLLKPNRLGLFDVLGNVFEWTLTRESHALNQQVDPIQDVEERLKIEDDDKFLRTGGGAGSEEISLRAANRAQSDPTEEEEKNGLRVVRTIRVLSTK